MLFYFDDAIRCAVSAEKGPKNVLYSIGTDKKALAPVITLSLRLISWKNGPVKFQCCTILFFWTLFNLDAQKDFDKNLITKKVVK